MVYDVLLCYSTQRVCVLDEGSGQAKLLGFMAYVFTVVEQLSIIHEGIFALIDLAEIEK